MRRSLDRRGELRDGPGGDGPSFQRGGFREYGDDEGDNSGDGGVSSRDRLGLRGQPVRLERVGHGGLDLRPGRDHAGDRQRLVFSGPGLGRSGEGRGFFREFDLYRRRRAGGWLQVQAPHPGLRGQQLHLDPGGYDHLHPAKLFRSIGNIMREWSTLFTHNDNYHSKHDCPDVSSKYIRDFYEWNEWE